MASANIKRWADHWKFSAETKCGNLKDIWFTKFVITSNYSLDYIFREEDPSLNLEPLKKRFKVIH